MAILEGFGVFTLYHAEHFFLYAALGTLAAFLSLLLYKKRRQSGSGAVHTRFLPRLIIILLISELFVFNLNAYTLMFNEYPGRSFDFSRVVTEGFTQNEDGSLTGSGKITLKDLDIRVGTLTVALSSDERTVIPFTVNFTDETFSAFYRYGAIKG